MSSPVGVPTYPTLDGVHLEGISGPEAIERRAVAVKSIVESATAKRREQVRYWGAGYPAQKVVRSFTIKYGHLTPAWYDRIETLLAIPGTHRFVFFWKVETVTYAGDGTRSEFYLPWEVAIDTLSPPQGLSADRFEPVVQIWIRAAETDPWTEGATLTYYAKNAVDYAAGTPAAGTVWFLEGGEQFKLNSAPSSGDWVVCRVVPVFEVLVGQESGTQYQMRSREPRDITLLEVS
jgi:hypothetical protein